VTPVSKVLQMLESMIARGQKEKAEEAAQYQEFAQYCHDTKMEKTWAIADANEKIEQLEADIAKCGADIARLEKEIEALDGDIAAWQGDKAAAIKNREQEHNDYVDTHNDYGESIDALRRAIAVLKAQDYKRAQAPLSSLIQLRMVPEHAKRVITAFLAEDPNTTGLGGLSYSAPEAYGYEFQSGGVIEMLEKLLTKFLDEMNTLEREETQAQHAFEMMVQDLDNSIETATDQRNNKAEEKAGHEEENGDDKAELDETIAARDADQKELDDLIALCQQKADEFACRSALRAEELDALSEAVDIISNNVSGLAQKHLPTLAQTALVQLRSRSANDAQKRVVAYLFSKAKELNSRVLFQLAAKAQDDPFKKVKKMIQDLITRLMEEANAEAEHKGWCDTELATNEQTRKQKTAEIDDLSAKIDKLNADIALLSQEISDLAADIAAIDKAVAEATELRTTEHATNMETIQDSKDAQGAVAKALVILKEYYAKAQGPALVQEEAKAKEEPVEATTCTNRYTGMTGAAGGVIGMLEVIQSDFARLQFETESAEQSAAAAYKKFMQDSALDKLAKEKDVEYKKERKNRLESALATAEQDREASQKELDAALAYYEKLKPSCVEAGVSYEDRVARRKEEIESLQECLRILSGEDFAA